MHEDFGVSHHFLTRFITFHFFYQPPDFNFLFPDWYIVVSHSWFLTWCHPLSYDVYVASGHGAPVFCDCLLSSRLLESSLFLTSRPSLFIWTIRMASALPIYSRDDDVSTTPFSLLHLSTELYDLWCLAHSFSFVTINFFLHEVSF